MTVVRISGAATVVAGPQRPPRPAWLAPGQARRLDPLALLIAAAVDQLPREQFSPEMAVAVGTAWGSVHSTLSFLDGLGKWGVTGGSPAAFTTSVHHHAAGSLGELLGLHGPAATISSGSTSGLAALRWASTILAQGRAPAALVVAADLPNPWSGRIVAELSRCPFAIGGGATALLLSTAGVGRTFRFAPPTDPTLTSCDGGGATPGEERILVRRAVGTRIRAVDRFAAWWPTAALGALPWNRAEALIVREVGDGILSELVLDAPSTGER